ncbi:MAG: restriction endonuclease [Piscirickettsiaceae bacterium]|nr:restriction endonuclease [Piscirickettsiaceae bacterium]
MESADTVTSLPKPFILLSGISGTGKTRFVKQQAQKFRADGSNYQLVPVRPDWHEPSDLLGYVSRLGANGAEYIVTDFLVFLVSAWKEMVEGVDAGEIIYKSDAVPFWLCLDEMNLAPVEQYFADYLSVIETRQWDDGLYSCEPLLNASLLGKGEYASRLRSSLHLDGDANDALWGYFIANGIGIPPNLIVAGTVNMDETTHGFSRKVIDRAFTLDFGEFFPNDYSAYFEDKTKVKALSYPTLSRVDEVDLADYDESGMRSIAFLEAINSILKTTPFELAYRALNELLLAVVCFQPKDENELQAVWDDFLMTKVLPRIEGDAEKLGDDGEDSLLSQLNKLLEHQLADIWNDQRIDLLREDMDGGVLMVDCRSKNKIAWMQDRLKNNSFTSFWP